MVYNMLLYMVYNMLLYMVYNMLLYMVYNMLLHMVHNKTLLCRHLQFIWMGDSETASSIVMGRVAVPFIFVLEPDTQLYYMPEVPTEDMTIDTLAAFLDEVIEGKSPVST